MEVNFLTIIQGDESLGRYTHAPYFSDEEIDGFAYEEMSGDLQLRIKTPAWESARMVWSAGDVDLPATMNSNNAHFLADLRRATANFRSAKTVSDVDRDRDWSFDELADRCRELSDTLSRMDTVASARIAGASTVSFTPQVGETITNLDLLEAAVKHGPLWHH